MKITKEEIAKLTGVSLLSVDLAVHDWSIIVTLYVDISASAARFMAESIHEHFRLSECEFTAIKVFSTSNRLIYQYFKQVGYPASQYHNWKEEI